MTLIPLVKLKICGRCRQPLGVDSRAALAVERRRRFGWRCPVTAAWTRQQHWRLCHHFMNETLVGLQTRLSSSARTEQLRWPVTRWRWKHTNTMKHCCMTKHTAVMHFPCDTNTQTHTPPFTHTRQVYLCLVMSHGY